MDNLTKEQRRRNMQNIRSQGTSPEKIMEKELKRRKIYFAKHPKTIIGKPDIVFRRKKIAIFIDSDFWHCNPKKFIMPKTNATYWEEKIKNNKARDKLVNQTLRKEGWKVIRIWESSIKKNTTQCVNRILKALNTGSTNTSTRSS